MSWAGSLTRRLWPALLGGVAIVALVLLGRRNGRLEEQIRAARASAQVKERMDDAARRTPTDRAGVARRLREGRF